MSKNSSSEEWDPNNGEKSKSSGSKSSSSDRDSDDGAEGMAANKIDLVEMPKLKEISKSKMQPAKEKLLTAKE